MYRADMRSPRSLLQALVDQQKTVAESSDEQERVRAERMLKQYGATPEEVVASGWRVARIPLNAFQDLTLTGPDLDGHVDITGPYEAFATASEEWIRRAIVLTEQVCLEDVLFGEN